MIKVINYIYLLLILFFWYRYFFLLESIYLILVFKFIVEFSVENIYIIFIDGIEIFWGVGGFVRLKKMKENV